MSTRYYRARKGPKKSSLEWFRDLRNLITKREIRKTKSMKKENKR